MAKPVDVERMMKAMRRAKVCPLVAIHAVMIAIAPEIIAKLKEADHG